LEHLPRFQKKGGRVLRGKKNKKKKKTGVVFFLAKKQTVVFQPGFSL